MRYERQTHLIYEDGFSPPTTSAASHNICPYDTIHCVNPCAVRAHVRPETGLDEAGSQPPFIYLGYNNTCLSLPICTSCGRGDRKKLENIREVVSWHTGKWSHASEPCLHCNVSAQGSVQGAHLYRLHVRIGVYSGCPCSCPCSCSCSCLMSCLKLPVSRLL